jgi:hypothetical protein
MIWSAVRGIGVSEVIHQEVIGDEEKETKHDPATGVLHYHSPVRLLLFWLVVLSVLLMRHGGNSGGNRKARKVASRSQSHVPEQCTSNARSLANAKDKT